MCGLRRSIAWRRLERGSDEAVAVCVARTFNQKEGDRRKASLRMTTVCHERMNAPRSFRSPAVSRLCSGDPVPHEGMGVPRRPSVMVASR